MRSKNFQIISLSKKNNYLKKKKNITYKSIDISNKKKLNKISKIKFKIVINLGGNINHQNPKETVQAHFYGLKNVLKTINLKNLNLFIQIGSSLEYGTSRSPHLESQLCKPNSLMEKQS